MQNENIPSTEMKDSQQGDVRKVTQDVGRLEEAFDRFRREARQAEVDVERHDKQIQSHRRSAYGLWTVVVLLIIALAAMASYGYPELRAQGMQIAEALGVRNALAATRDRVGSLEERMAGMAADRDQTNARLTGLERLEKAAGARVANVQSESQRLMSQAEQRIGAELRQDLRALQSRVAGVESAQETDQVRLTALQGDLTRTRAELTNLRQETDQQLAGFHRETSGNFSEVNNRIASTRENLDNLTNRVGNFRVNFELGTDRSEELYSGVRMTVSHTNVGRQHLDGWLLLVKDGRTIFVRDHGIDQPVVFYTGKDDRPYQLVFTRVQDHAVAGYLLIPNEPESKVAAAGN